MSAGNITRREVIEYVHIAGAVTTADIGEYFGLTPDAAHAHLSQAVADGTLVRSEGTRPHTYRPATDVRRMSEVDRLRAHMTRLSDAHLRRMDRLAAALERAERVEAEL